jgi:hypothetical protein
MSGLVRAGGLEVVESADGFVVYQPDRDRVHFFNHTAVLVLELCDGEKDEGKIVELVQRFYELPEPPELEVRECLDMMRTERLVV